MTQLPMFDTLQDRFEKFDKSNPKIYALLVELAMEARADGVRHWGIKAMCEVARYRLRRDVRTKDEPWAVNNSYTSRYARKLIAEYPEFEPMFETRRLSA